MEAIADDVEATIQKLCAEASAERDQVKLRDVRSRLEAYLHEHASILTSMSEDTYQALCKIKPVRRRVSSIPPPRWDQGRSPPKQGIACENPLLHPKWLTTSLGSPKNDIRNSELVSSGFPFIRQNSFRFGLVKGEIDSPSRGSVGLRATTTLFRFTPSF